MTSGTGGSGGHPDGVRVLRDDAARRARRWRLVVGVLATAAVVVSAVTVTAVMLLRRMPPPSATPAASTAGEQPRADAAAPPRVARAVPKFATPRAESTAGTMRRASRPVERRPPQGASTNPSSASAKAAVADPNAAPTDSLEDREHSRKLESLAREVIDGLKATGETGGLAAFPPPGTVPIKVGLVVPEGFELPEGYMRYYQTTDDGQRLEPILMFSPDYQFVDADGKAIEVPKDGVVPPELAPPGMPHRTLEVPKMGR